MPGLPIRFVALDTVGGKAYCVDLQGHPEDITAAKLRLDGGRLHVGALATIDTRTLKASSGDTPAPRTDPRGGGTLLRAALAIVAVAAALVALATRPGRRRSAGSRPRSTPVR